MTRPYFLYSGFRFLIDAPLLFFSLWIAENISEENFFSGSHSFTYIFLLLSIISWYSSAQISGLSRDLRSNKFAEEIIYVLVTLIIFVIMATSTLPKTCLACQK